MQWCSGLNVWLCVGYLTWEFDAFCSGHIQILIVYDLLSGFSSCLPLLPANSSLASILNHVCTQTGHPGHHCPCDPVLSFTNRQGKHQRKAFQHPFCVVLHFPSFLWDSVFSSIQSSTIWWKPYRALKMLFTGNQPSGSSVWYMRWSWKPTTENAAASMRELKRILDSLKSHSQWLGEEDENPGFQHRVRSGTSDISIRHNAYSEGTKVLVVGH